MRRLGSVTPSRLSGLGLLLIGVALLAWVALQWVRHQALQERQAQVEQDQKTQLLVEQERRRGCHFQAIEAAIKSKESRLQQMGMNPDGRYLKEDYEQHYQECLRVVGVE